MESQHEQVKQKLKEIIVKDLDINVGVEDIDDEVSLYEDGVGLDSISIVNFIVHIESTFGFCFGEDDINAELFSNINSLAGFIATRGSKVAV